MTTPRRGVSISIYLIDGTPDGMRLSTKSGWSGSCLDFARSDFAQAREREECRRTGVYVLLGSDPGGDGSGLRVYVGEADVVRSRLDQHQKEKDFWTRAFVFTSKDNSLNKAHVRYLEARLIGLAKEAGTGRLDNSTVPDARGLGEAERDEMETYLDDVLLLLPLLGVQHFSPVELPLRAIAPARPYASEAAPVAAPQHPEPGMHGQSGADDEGETAAGTRYFLRERGRGPAAVGVAAEGRDTARGFIVLAGATGPAEDKKMSPTYSTLRTRLCQDGLLEPGPPDTLRLVRDYLFDSPSAAAAVIAGSNRNGPKSWRDRSGATLKEHRAAVVRP